MPPNKSHSIKVPRLYKLAAKILEESEKQGGGVKDLLYQHQHKHPNLKGILALIAKTLQYQKTLEDILEKSKILKEETGLSSFLAKVLITELLWGKKELKGESKPVTTVLSYREKLEEFAYNAVQEVHKKSEKRPRYVRVNTIKLSVNDAVQGFKDEGWNFIEYNKNMSYEKYLEMVKTMTSDDFLIDFHIEELLVFPPYTDFHKHEAYLQGSIMLQDKASCLPVKLLNPPPGSVVLDVCAAPGMKSTQLAAIMNDTGKVFSIEFNDKRIKALEDVVEQSGCNCVQIIKEDALSLCESDFPDAEYAVVDPSCSGSGIDRLGSVNVSKDRLLTLSRFQAKILKHVMKTFPKLKRVVYSTCSIHPVENEQVVQDIIKVSDSFKLVSLKEYFRDNWLNYGSGDFGEVGERCIYAKPNVDLTIGFFVAVFERLEEGERNEFLDEDYINEVVLKGRMECKHDSGKKRRKDRKNEKDGGNVKSDVNLAGEGSDLVVENQEDRNENVDEKEEGEEKKKVRTKRGRRAPKEVRKLKKKGNYDNEIEVQNEKQEDSGEGTNENRDENHESLQQKKKKKKRKLENDEEQADISGLQDDSEAAVTSQKKKRKQKATDVTD